jgi:hypothetical protein
MLSGSIDPIGLDIDVLIEQEFSPAARAQALADVARAQLAEAQAADKAALGFVPEHTTTVDGQRGADEDRVRPDGVIVYSFALMGDLLAWVSEQLHASAPVRSGHFRASIALFADGVEVDAAGDVPAAKEYVFVSQLPYARKIEGSAERPPESPQAPHGVFEAVAALAAQRFGGQALITFAFRAPVRETTLRKAGSTSDGLVPSVVITLRD